MPVDIELKQVTPATQTYIINHPANLNYLVYELDEAFQQKPPELIAVLTENDAVEPIELKKAWAGILYLLGEFSPVGEIPLGACVLGLNGIRPETDEEETVRYLAPEEVKMLVPALNEISEDKLFANYNPDEMRMLEDQAENLNESGSVNDKKYLWKYFCSLREYYQDAAQRGNGMIIFKS